MPNRTARLILTILASSASFLLASALVRGGPSFINAARVHAAPVQEASPQAPARRYYLVVLHNQVKAGKVKITDDEFKALIGRHFAQLKKHFADGKVILAGPRLDEVDGISVLEVGSEAEAQEIAANDACVKAGIFTYELHELRLALLRGSTPGQ